MSEVKSIIVEDRVRRQVRLRTTALGFVFVYRRLDGGSGGAFIHHIFATRTEEYTINSLS